MKKIYLLASLACLSLAAKAQIYSNNFESKIPTQFITATNNEFSGIQSVSNLIIDTKGHDEWSSLQYSLNDGTNATTTSFSKADTIYVRAKAVFANTNNPVLSISFQDVNNVGPNNETFNSVNKMTLTNDYQVFKFTVTDWNDTYGTSKLDMDSTMVSKIVFAPNGGFASYPSKNNLDQDINESLNGTIYIDYVSIGSQPSNGVWIDAASTYEQNFDTDVTANITSAASFVVSSTTSALTIESQGHDQWETVNLDLADNVIDLTSNPMIEFTASAVTASEYTGDFGIMIVAVNELGQRIETAGAYVIQSLTSVDKTIQVSFDSFKDSEGNVVSAKRITSLEILINPGFAEYPQDNDLGKSVTTAFEGTITISNIKLGDAVEANGLLSTSIESLAFYPNPTVNILNVGNELEGAIYSIISLTGSEVKSGVLTATQLSVSDLEEGMYIIQATLGSNVYTNTFVKQ